MSKGYTRKNIIGDDKVVCSVDLGINEDTGADEHILTVVTEKGCKFEFYENGKLSGTWENIWDWIIEVM